MRTTIIPAQITTVEDKIAGSLNLTQIMILMVPVFWGTIVYAIFPDQMRLSFYKLPLVLTVALLCSLLSMRIKGKVVINWLAVLIKFNIRPRYYLFDKNEAYLRDLYLPEFENKPLNLFKKAERNNDIKIPDQSFGVKELMSLKAYINNPNYSLSLKPDQKGGLYVACHEIKK